MERDGFGEEGVLECAWPEEQETAGDSRQEGWFVAQQGGTHGVWAAPGDLGGELDV